MEDKQAPITLTLMLTVNVKYKGECFTKEDIANSICRDCTLLIEDENESILGEASIELKEADIVIGTSSRLTSRARSVRQYRSGGE